MDPTEGEGYTPSWAPFGMTTASVTAGTRIPMAPFGRMSRLVEEERAATTPPDAPRGAEQAVAVRTAAPATARARQVQAPRPPQASRQTQPRSRQQARPPQPQPSYPQPPYPPPGAPQGTVPVGFPGRPGVGTGDPSADLRSVLSGRRAGRTGAAPSFDPLAVVALVMSVFFAPFGLILALASLSRARKTGVSPALSVLALVFAIGALVLFIGIGPIIALLGS